MKKYVLHLFVGMCFLKAAMPPEGEAHTHSVADTNSRMDISQLNDPAIDAATLRKFWCMSDHDPSLRVLVGNAVRRKITEPNAAPAILQLARDMGKFYEEYPGLREQVAAILRSRLMEPCIDLVILQVALSTGGFDPELYKQAASIIRRNIRRSDTPLSILKLAFATRTYNEQGSEDEVSIKIHEEILAIIDSKITGATTNPCVLELAWYTRDRALREKIETIVHSLFAGGAPVTDTVILHLARQMNIT